MNKRDRFEAWYRSKYRLVYLVWMDEFGEYESESEETAWQAWNQALELTATEFTEYRRTIENDTLERAAQGFDSLLPEKHLDAGCIARALREMKG
jgi:hypothetical protein